MPNLNSEDFKINVNKSIEKLHKASFHQVKQYILNNRGTIEDAEDLFSDACVKLIENINNDKFNEQASISTYFFSICKFSWMNHLRKKKIEVSDNEFENDTLTGDYLIDFEDEKKSSEEIEKVIKALETLGLDCKLLLKKYYFNKEKLKNIAIEMNYTSQFVRVKKNRCLNALRKLVIKS